MNPIDMNATRLLELMVESNEEQFDNTWLQGRSELTPRDINDAIDHLESLGAIDAIRVMGTAPFDFGFIMLKSRGRYLFNEIKAEREAKNSTELSASLPARPLNPVGSPYGFTEDDWITVSLQKEDSQTLYVVMGMQFKSEFYDRDALTRNIQSVLQDAVQQYNEHRRDSKISLHFAPLAAGLGEHLFNEIARGIIGADIAVFDTSDLNPNVMLEMGVALTWGVKVLPIRGRDCPKPPSDISGQTWTDYEDSGARILDDRFDRKLEKMIERIMASKKARP